MITILKLTNGVEVVGEVEHENSHEVVLKNALQINYRQGFATPIPTVSFVRYIMFAGTDTVTFDRMHIMNQVRPRASFEKFYYVAVKQFSEDVEQLIDNELSDIPTTENRLEGMLEGMSVEGMTIN